jgi:hypothetical protein
VSNDRSPRGSARGLHGREPRRNSAQAETSLSFGSR